MDDILIDRAGHFTDADGTRKNFFASKPDFETAIAPFGTPWT